MKKIFLLILVFSSAFSMNDPKEIVKFELTQNNPIPREVDLPSDLSGNVEPSICYAPKGEDPSALNQYPPFDINNLSSQPAHQEQPQILEAPEQKNPELNINQKPSLFYTSYKWIQNNFFSNPTETLKTISFAAISAFSGYTLYHIIKIGPHFKQSATIYEFLQKKKYALGGSSLIALAEMIGRKTGIGSPLWWSVPTLLKKIKERVIEE